MQKLFPQSEVLWLIDAQLYALVIIKLYKCKAFLKQRKRCKIILCTSSCILHVKLHSACQITFCTSKCILHLSAVQTLTLFVCYNHLNASKKHMSQNNYFIGKNWRYQAGNIVYNEAIELRISLSSLQTTKKSSLEIHPFFVRSNFWKCN